jgi:hypothetical protein
MQLQYLETLKQVGSSSSTKLLVPMEILSGLHNILSPDSGRGSDVMPLGEITVKSE